MENGTLHDYLTKGQAIALERELNLVESVGFVNDYFDFDKAQWGGNVKGLDEDESYRKFLSTAWTYPSLIGKVVEDGILYTTTILIYQGSYRVQVECKDPKSNTTEYATGVIDNYVGALRIAYGVIKGVDYYE